MSLHDSWSPTSWRAVPIKQQPSYKDHAHLQLVEQQLASFAPLVTADEVLHLRQKLVTVEAGQAFLLQGGDCAESFSEFSVVTIRELLRVILQMALILSYSRSKPVVKIARLAGQFAKPRSNPTETQGNTTLPTYRGDIINDIAFTASAREANPERMIQAYNQAVQTINVVRAYINGGLGAMTRVHDWNLSYVRQHTSARYHELCQKITSAIQFIGACGIDPECHQLSQTDIFTSHEALLLHYEQALTHQDAFTKQFVDCSAHMLWIGDRTKALGEAHVEFLRGVANPIGIKVGPKTDTQELLAVINTLNPTNEAGKIVLIIRMGDAAIAKHFPPIARQVRNAGKRVVWSTDPMHGNTRSTESGYKTREFEAIVGELTQFFAICKQEGIYGGGIHLEMTSKNVTECIGGGCNSVSEDDISMRYHTHCDPRLNATQAIEIAFLLADIIDQNSAP